MNRLKTFQQDMTAYVLGGKPSSSLLASVVKTPLGASDRLQIHRNTYRLTLSSALVDVYPIVQSFVGRDWLEAALKKFVTEHPPQSACLAEYGGGFADFLDGFEPAASLVYLSDISRLEWAIHTCQNARDEKFLSGKDWTGFVGPDVGEKTLRLVEAHHFISSQYPLLDLWNIGSGADADGEINLDSGGVNLLVIRPDTEVLMYSLELSEYTFLSRLNAGGTLLAAAESVDWAHEASPMMESMMRFASSGFFSAETEDLDRTVDDHNQ